MKKRLSSTTKTASRRLPAAHGDADNLRVAYVRLSNLDQAIDSFSRAVQLNPSYQPAIRHLAGAQTLKQRSSRGS
jgi:tetratricopeptide (TPR) repeat protein